MQFILQQKTRPQVKEYIDPYRNIPMDVAIKDSTKKFGKKIQEDIADFLPYDMSKQQYSRTVGAMKRLLEQAIKRHYSK
jgi:hypothetical protein